MCYVVIGEQSLYEMKWTIKVGDDRIKLNPLGRKDPSIYGIGEKYKWTYLAFILILFFSCL